MSNSMSVGSGSEQQEPLFRNKFQTDFMRVPQLVENEVPDRHPGSSKSPVGMLSRKLSGNSTWTSGPSSPVAYSGTATQGPMQIDVMCCPVCKVDYDTVLKRPMLLPGCGHTLCSVCVKEISTPILQCPICSRSSPGVMVDSLPVNISLEALLVNKYGETTLQKIVKEQGGSGKSNKNCLSHGIRLSFWCRTCEAVACGECLFDKHPPAEGHTLTKLQDVASEIRDKAVATISVCHEDATKLFSGHLKLFVALLGDLHEAGKLMQDSRKLVAAAECAQDFGSVTSVFDAIKKVNEQVQKLKLENDESKSTKEITSKTEKTEESTGEGSEQSEEAGESEKEISQETPHRETKVAAANDQVFAMHSDGRLARVATEEHGLHIYSLSQYPTTDYSVAVRLGLLMEFIQGQSLTVFLDFSRGSEKLGRIYLQLRGDMKRSLQFLHLCLGTLGPSYKGSRIDGISEKGSPGEYLRLGDYTGQGGQGGVGIIDGLEWGSNWSAAKKGGQVCGVGGDAGEKRFGALFALCIRDNPKDQFRCPFGVVCRGMTVLYSIAKMENVETVHISDCGALISID